MCPRDGVGANAGAPRASWAFRDLFRNAEVGGKMPRMSKMLRMILEDTAMSHPKPDRPTQFRICPKTEDRHVDHRLICDACAEGECAALQELGLDVNHAPLPRKSRPACGARTRTGTPCRMKIEPGKRRCRLHGGLSTGPKTKEGRIRIAEAQRKRWSAWRKKLPDDS